MRQIAIGVVCALTLTLPAAAEEITFGRDILPILSDKCFHCHGPDPKSREADLRLDVQSDALRKEMPVIVPGQANDSEVIRRITSTDPEKVMPPPATKKSLTPKEIALLRKWIDAGAPWGKHWAFEPAVRPAVPATQPDDVVRNPIDAFALARMRGEGMSPQPEANKVTLLRRVTLDLTGLPPTPAEVDAFLADNAPEAYEKVVDRLLQSPRYGERMVWEWLDAARYADTNGYQGDPTRAMWYWRDWAIQALNDNIPFDQFTIEQLAGDLLPQPSDAQLIATGFHRNHMINGEGGRIAEESRVDYVQDRVETTGAVWMGLTLYCCRCHNHKYDPITQQDYYQLAAYFNSIDESGGNDAGGLANPVFNFAPPEQKKRLEDLKQSEQATGKARDELEKTLKEKTAEWAAALVANGAAKGVQWTPLVPTSANTKTKAELQTLEDQSLRASGENPDKDAYTVVCRLPAGKISGLRLEVLPDDAFVSKGPGRADNGNFVLNLLTMKVGEKDVPLTYRGASFSQQGWDGAAALDDKPATGWAVSPEFGKTHSLTFTPRDPLTTTDDKTEATIQLTFDFGRQHTLGRFRFVATQDDPALLDAVPADVQTILAKATAERSEAEWKKLTEYHRDADADYRSAKKAADDAKKARTDFENGLPRTMVMRERAQPRETFILARGVYNKPGDKVTHGTPAVLPPLPENAPTNRLALAQWLMSPQHPLTARVTVNRQWQQFFGVGLVKTAEDFGVQGERPVQSALLDWLACEFREPTVPQPSVATANGPNRWNVKHLQRLIVTSAIYRQASTVAPGMAERDPENRFLARGPRYRLPSWMIRDQALAASGLLVEKQGGPPVKGYQPTGVWEEATFGTIRYAQDKGEALYRRSVYQFWRRIVGPTVFFDVASRQTCSVKSQRTNTPLQALTTLNDVTYVEAARALAERVLTPAEASDAERIAQLFRRVIARPPKAAELETLTASLGQLRQAYQQDIAAAEKLLKVGESPRNAQLNAAEHAAFTALASVVLNLDEALTKE